jgi:hypothetical protein
MPYGYRIRDELTPKKHRRFVAKKRAAIEKMDAHPIPVGSNRELPVVPVIRVSIDGLSDPTTKHAHNREREKRLSEIITQSSTEPSRIRHSKPQERTLNWNALARDRQTRFCFGQTETGESVGRRSFRCHNCSDMAHTLEMFDARRT